MFTTGERRRMRTSILIVDDDEDILFLANKLFPRIAKDFDIITASSAQEALRIFSSDSIDAIICDFHLGPREMNGLDLLEWIREEGYKIPFIIFTGRGREEIAIQALNMGADYYLEKTDNFEEMFKEITHYIREVVGTKGAGSGTQSDVIEDHPFLRKVIDSLPHPFYVIKVDDYSIEIANTSTGIYGSAESSTCYQLTHRRQAPCSGEICPCPLELVVDSKEPVVVEHHHVDSQGNVRDINVHAYPILDEKGDVVQMIEYAIDVTDLKATLKALEASESRFRDLFMKAPLAYQSMDPSGIIRDVNDAWLECFGYKWDEVIGKPFKTFLSLDQRELFQSRLDKFLREGISRDEEYHIQKHDGSTLIVRLSGNIAYGDQGEVVQVHYILEDITERKEIEKRVRIERDRAQTYLDLAGVVIVAMDIEGTITMLNRRGFELTGYIEHEIIGQNFFKLLSPSGQSEHLRNLYRQVINECTESISNFEGTIVTKDGREKILNWTVSLLRNNSGEVIGTLSSGEDITETRIAYDMLYRQKEELSELAHIMSHDLGNKMKTIISLTRLLRDEFDTEVLDRITSTAVQSAQLLQRSAELAEAGAVIQKKQAVNLEWVIHEIAQTLFPDDLKIHVSKLQTVLGSPERIGQIFQNLFSNAIEHGNATEIWVEGKLESSGYCIYVRNNGVPIPNKHRKKIFEKGFSTEKEGRGLGLSIVRKMVQAHGWSIQLEPCEETTFKICTSNLIK